MARFWQEELFNCTYLIETYDGWSDLLDWIGGDRESYFGRNSSHKESKHASTYNPAKGRFDGMAWSGTETWEEAWELAQTGWEDGRKWIENIEAPLPTTPTEYRKYRREVGGAFASVPHYVSGDPQHMLIDYKRPVEWKKFAQLFINGGANCNVDADVFLRYAIAICSLIDKLENNGTQVEVIQFYHDAGTSNTSLRWLSLTTLKRVTDFLSLDMLLFAIGHPARFRRLGFRQMEIHPNPLIKGMGSNYGRSLELVSSRNKNWDKQLNRIYGISTTEETRHYLPSPSMFQRNTVPQIIKKLETFLQSEPS